MDQSCPLAHATKSAVSGEFVLTGLSNPDGHIRNHELGICMPQFELNLTADCKLTLVPKHVGNAFISLLRASSNLPRATDSASTIANAVHHTMGYYYLQPQRCPARYSSSIRGQALVAEGACGARARAIAG